MLTKLRFVFVGLLALTLLISTSLQAQETVTRTLDKDLRGGPETAITNPKLITVSEADPLYHPNEPLIVLLLPGETHGYSLWHLDNYEVVNVQVGSVGLVVTWYPFSMSAAVYENKVDNSARSFRSVGFLYQNTRIIEDVETSSLWSQVSGKCFQGELQGTQLTRYPASFMTYADYKKNYPGGFLLAKDEKGRGRDSHVCPTGGEEAKLTFGEDEAFKKLEIHEPVYGIDLGDQSVVITASKLKESGKLVLEKTDPPVYLTYYEKGGSVAAFSLAGVDPKIASKLSNMYDKITTSDGAFSWSSITGKLLKGDGADLPRIPIVPTCWHAWYGFYPESELIK